MTDRTPTVADPWEVRRWHRAMDETEWIVIPVSEPKEGWPSYIAVLPYSRRADADAIVAAHNAGPVVAVTELLIDWNISREQTCGYTGCSYYRPSKKGRKEGRIDLPHKATCPVGAAVGAAGKVA